MKALKINENSLIRYIFGIKVPKLVENKGIVLATFL